jgi:hypothetical protein
MASPRRASSDREFQRVRPAKIMKYIAMPTKITRTTAIRISSCGIPRFTSYRKELGADSRRAERSARGHAYFSDLSVTFDVRHACR